MQITNPLVEEIVMEGKMKKVFITTMYLFITITGLTAFATIIGVFIVWFSPKNESLPYLKWLISSVLMEIVLVVMLNVKKGFKYMPDCVTDKEKSDTMKFMEQFISVGSSATIVSNRVSWLTNNENLLSTLKSKIEAGIKIEIITPNPVSTDITEQLCGADFYVTKEATAPEARFTLINSNRSGAEKLAIAKGVHPEHEITIFDNDSGPQIIAMAKDIIRKSKEISNANK